MKLRTQILLFLFLFGLVPLSVMVVSNLPFVLDRLELFYHKAHLQNLRADFRDLDEHLASRHEMLRLLAKLPEPGGVLGESGVEDEARIDKARVNYTRWINKVLRDQFDIIQILFLDDQASPRFWLERNARTQRWEPSATQPDLPNLEMRQAGMRQELGTVAVSLISLNPAAAHDDPRRFMTLRMVSPIEGSGPQGFGKTVGAVVANVDVGGMARAYRNTLWVNNDGVYLEEQISGGQTPRAFTDFAGLKEIFTVGKLALWKGDAGQQVIWVPMFMTEDSGPLWVGRAVDPSPLSKFRNTLVMRVLTIVFVVSLLVLLSARWIALSVSRFGQTLTEGVGRVLREDEPVRFHWRGPREIRDLGEQLTVLAEAHTHHSEEQRQHARQLEESNRYKSEFLANVSHELRTPLNSILLLSKMLSEGPEALHGAQRKQVSVIHEAGADLKALIDNILDLSRIEAGQASFSLERIDLRRLIEELMELVKPQFDAKSLSFTSDIAPDAPESFVSDHDKVRQILKNFLSNAVKFTKSGGVTIHAYEGEDSARPVCIGVEDSGIGIPGDKLGEIFEAFKQADGSTSRRFGGTGLGLSISRELAHLMDGDIRLESEEEKGSVFTLCLPLEFDHSDIDEARLEHVEPEVFGMQEHQPEPLIEPEDMVMPQSATAGAADFNGKRVLLVDDDLRNLLALSPLLESWGLEITAAGDGREALETLEEDPEFSIVLMDIMMPEMDGYDTIRHIREDGRFRDMAVVALTAKNTALDRERCIEAGADDFIPKPIDADELKALIARHLPL
ncbi:MAG: response regulator [gamma proteobacterium endosymbiont of Lamellibrachia anaximandri]|nr:response regulator [gamma proteobacterium endosymbiont of Lamellibrachia anaximandri]